MAERIDKSKKAHRLLLCLKSVHTSLKCRKKGKVECTRYRKLHHQSLCDEVLNNTSVCEQIIITGVGKVDIDTSAFTYLQKVRVRFTGPTGLSKINRCVLEVGSQSSFITNTLIEDLKLKTIEHRELNVSAFESRSAPPSQRRIIRFNVKSIWSICTNLIGAYGSAYMLTPLPAVPQKFGNLARGRRIRFADPKTDAKVDLPVEIIIDGASSFRIQV